MYHIKELKEPHDFISNIHIETITKRASKQLFFLKQLRRSGLSQSYLRLFYVTKIRPGLEYGASVQVTSLTDHISRMLEAIQKRAFRIVYGRHEYETFIELAFIPTLKERRMSLCNKTSFSKIEQTSHPLHNILLSSQKTRSTRSQKKTSFINYCLFNFH